MYFVARVCCIVLTYNHRLVSIFALNIILINIIVIAAYVRVISSTGYTIQ